MPALAVAIFVVYLRTGAPGAWWGDGLELACAAKTLGVPHPTGYPLYTVLGWTAMHVLPWVDPGRALTILSALACAASAWVAGLLALRWLEGEQGARASGGARRTIALAAAAGAMLFWAFARTIWEHATFAEVYPLTLLLAVALVAVAARPDSRPRRRAAALGMLWGLAALNHYSIVELAPFVVFALLDSSRSPEGRIRARAVAANLGSFLAVSSLCLLGYLYLPLRAAANPPLNWGDPSNLERLLWVLRGGYFINFDFFAGESRLVSAAKGLQTWLDGWGRQVAPDSLAALRMPLGCAIAAGALAGCFLIAKRRPLFGWGLFATLLTSAFVLASYRIRDPEGYVFPAMPAAFLGWIELVRFGVSRAPALSQRRWLPALVPAPAVLLASLHYGAVDKSWDDGPSRWAAAALDAAPQGALLITRERWDSEIFALWYEQIVHGRRLDVTVYGSGFIFRGWYRKYFEAAGRPRIPIYVGDRAPEDKTLFDTALIGGVILPNIGSRRVLVTFQDDVLEKHFSPRRSAILLPRSYYAATAYKLLPPGPFVFELQAPSRLFSIPPTHDEMLEFFTAMGPEYRRRYLELSGELTHLGLPAKSP